MTKIPGVTLRKGSIVGQSDVKKQVSLDSLGQMMPDADLGDIQTLPEQLKKDAADMFKDEEAKTEAAKNILTRNGKEKDDVTLVSIAMNLGMGIISKETIPNGFIRKRLFQGDHL